MINEHSFDFSGGEVSPVSTTGLDPDDETKKLVLMVWSTATFEKHNHDRRQLNAMNIGDEQNFSFKLTFFLVALWFIIYCELCSYY